MSAEQAWQIKEGLRDWYATATKETAADQLDCWIDQVNKSTCDPLKKALSVFRRWRGEILAFFEYRISNGFVEGKNNRTKMMMRRSYGFKNRQHLRFRILAGKPQMNQGFTRKDGDPFCTIVAGLGPPPLPLGSQAGYKVYYSQSVLSRASKY